jgi:hypothetical protein
MMAPKQPFRFDSWISFLDPKEFYSTMDQGNIDSLGEPIWATGNFDLTFEISKENER